MPDDPLRSRAWKKNPHPRYWWHQLPDNDYVPPIYSDLTEAEWKAWEERNKDALIASLREAEARAKALLAAAPLR